MFKCVSYVILLAFKKNPSQLVPSIGATYEVQEDMVAEGHYIKELYKGDMVKLIEVCDNNLFHILALPMDENTPGIEGYVSPGLVKKIGSSEGEEWFVTFPPNKITYKVGQYILGLIQTRASFW